ncbi:hypothetical protein ACFRI7_35865 [Streptomyces sp. NPDC056716]|uniref:hypothetical protein n=1 Tax=unclassified Streptomyces TaxID=2593676 RepID=UPI003693D13C
MDSEGTACPVCGQPVETVVKRYKTLGAWVPRWVPGPCRNRECASYEAEAGAEAVGETGGAEQAVRAGAQPVVGEAHAVTGKAPGAHPAP